jgi:hypothetical protein
MSASAAPEHVWKNPSYLRHENIGVPREDYYRRWQVDPESVNADFRELSRLEDFIISTAVYRLIALRQATAAGDQDWLPDPRFVDPKLRAAASRDAMTMLASRLSRFTREARGRGWSWDELARSVAAREKYPSFRISGATAFETVSGQRPEGAGMRTLSWVCSSCSQPITDRGPYGHPGDNESGHTADCARQAHEVAAYERRARPVIDSALLRTGPQREADNSTENLCRTIRAVKCTCGRCYYCERELVSRRHEHDHFPIPRSAGGVPVVPACLDCHELKDQFSLLGWPHAVLAAAWHGILTCLTLRNNYPDGDDLAYIRLVDWWEEQPDSSDEAVIARWSELRPLSRVLYGKVRAAKERHKYALSRANGTVSIL